MEEGGAFGYDFSKGYGGFGPEDDAPPAKPKRVGPIKRWLQARRTRKIQREVAQRAADEARLDRTARQDQPSGQGVADARGEALHGSGQCAVSESA